MASGYPSPPPGIGASGRSPPGEAPPPPPSVAPPPPPAGLGAVGEGRELELQKEITGTIETQVQRLIEQARRDTESKVKMELKSIHEVMVAMDGTLDGLLVQLEGMEPPQPAEPPMDAEIVGQLLSKIEQQWGQEIRTLKQELHQTILAHNHNADLIKHHKDTIDALRDRAVKFHTNNAKTSEINQQLQKLDARLKQQQKQRKLEPLFERLSALEQRLAVATGGAAAAWRYPNVPPPMPAPPLPGMTAMPPGLPPGMMPGMGSAAPSMQMMAAMRQAKAGSAAAAAKAEAKAAAQDSDDE